MGFFKNVKEQTGIFGRSLEEKMNSAAGKGKFSWGLVILFLSVIWAVIMFIRSVFYFFG